jgi:hypothetical protein
MLGREVYETAVADPDLLAGHPAVQALAVGRVAGPPGCLDLVGVAEGAFDQTLEALDPAVVEVIEIPDEFDQAAGCLGGAGSGGFPIAGRAGGMPAAAGPALRHTAMHAAALAAAVRAPGGSVWKRVGSKPSVESPANGATAHDVRPGERDTTGQRTRRPWDAADCMCAAWTGRHASG